MTQKKVSIFMGGTGANSAAEARGALGVLANTGGTISGDLVITGNLEVQGNSTTLNVEVLSVEDNEIILNSNVTGEPSLNAFITINRGSSSNTSLKWNESADQWEWTDDGSNFYTLNVARNPTLITQNVEPLSNITYDLGSSTKRFKDLWLSNSTIHLGEATISAQGGNVSFGNAEVQLSNVTTKLNVTNDLFVSGNVGIGTTNPAQKVYMGGETDTRLQIDGTTTQGIYFTKSANNNGTFRVNTDGNFEWYTKDVSPAMVLSANGNVGIGGITNPTAPIHAFKSNTSNSQTIVLGICSDSLRPVIQFSEGADVNFGTGMGIEYDGRGIGGTNALRFNSVDNVPVQTFMSNGWVGFGNTSPTAPLFIQHTNLPGEPYSGIYIKNIDTTGAAFTGVTADGALQSHYRLALNGSLKWQWRTGAGAAIDDLRAYSFTLNNDVMTLTAAGNVGIGVTNPDQPLAFTDSLGVKIQFNGINNNGYQIGLASSVNGGDAMMKFTAGEIGAGEFGFYNTTNARLFIANGGNVGIGTTNPSTKLHVNGGALIQGDLSLNNNNFTNFQLLGYENHVIRPASNGYGGFTLRTFDGSAAGFLLIRDTTDVDVYQEYGVTLVTDRGPITLAARGNTIGDNSPRNFIRFMTAGGVGSAQVRMTISKDGHITTPAQPAFHAYGASTASGNVMIFPNVYQNRGGHYNTSNGRFTAPVTGYYIFFWDSIANTTNDVYRFYIRVNGSNIGTGDFHLRLDTGETGAAYGPNASRVAMVALNQNDYVTIFFSSDGGTAHYVGADYATFGGYLLG